MARVKQYGVVFLLCGLALASLGFELRHGPGGVVALSAALAFLGLACGYLLSWPGLLGKTRRGGLLLSSYVFFWPYHLLNYASVAVGRLLGVPARSEILPGLYLGGRLFPWEASQLKPLGIASVLDLTCEFSEVGFLRRAPAYFCIPLLDGSAPTRAELEAGISFITERLRAGPVYVHCAMGHGRSATFVVGYLVASGKLSSLDEAMAHVRKQRPGVRLHADQLRSLQELTR
jgi:hypothetical protein